MQSSLRHKLQRMWYCFIKSLFHTLLHLTIYTNTLAAYAQIHTICKDNTLSYIWLSISEQILKWGYRFENTQSKYCVLLQKSNLINDFEYQWAIISPFRPWLLGFSLGTTSTFRGNSLSLPCKDRAVYPLPPLSLQTSFYLYKIISCRPPPPSILKL